MNNRCHHYLLKTLLLAFFSFNLVSTSYVLAEPVTSQQQDVIGSKRAAEVAKSQVAGKVLKVSLDKKQGVYKVKMLVGDKVKHIRVDAYSAAVL
ncbi:MAG: PepSY domain-containing protein [Pseudomonadales bacterium]|nr:PepSY domain-containing protein [Pseudomonadales bacterium]